MTLDWLGHHHAHHASAIHRLPAALKLGATLAIVGGTVLLPLRFLGWFICVSLLLVLATALSRIPLLFLLKRLAVLSPFVLGVALVNALQPGTGASWWMIALKSALCLLTVILLANTTPFNDMLRVLRRAHLPALLVTTLALMHRYLFVLAEEAERMRRARAGRTFTQRRRFRWQALATVVGQLFIRASERAERIYDAMCARGWK